MIGRWWKRDGDHLVCELCPRLCRMSVGQRGFCFVRRATEEGVELTTYGRSSGFCIDPIEKKPLNHFLPGTSVLSFGTAGCNLGCRFCQNWDISKARHMDRLMDKASPLDIATAAASHGCRSVAFTYNDPVIFAEYAIDTAAACQARGIASVAVTAGYVTARARPDFFAKIDAANVDLKAFTEDFYRRQCLGHLEPVKETLAYLVHETDTWVEITTLLIPDHNDGVREITQLARWVRDTLGTGVPVHFSAFHPDFKLDDKPPTPPQTLFRARDIARREGLRYVYTGNIVDPEGDSTWCPDCGALLIERRWYDLGRWGLTDGACGRCGTEVPGVFETRPGSWGRRRQRVRIRPS